MDSATPCVSFIGIVDFSQEARWLFMTDSVSDLLGYEAPELYGRPSLELVHPDEFARVRQLHYDTIKADKAAALVYLRMKHKDPFKGYILCGVSRTVVHKVVVGSVSYASPGAKALHNASTAQEITVISPGASGFQFRRWNDPSPMPPSPVLTPISLPSISRASSSRWQTRSRSVSPDRPQRLPPIITNEKLITYDHLPSQSFRTAFILDRFSLNCTIQYVSNDLMLSSTAALGRSFYDFVAKKDEEVVRSWIDVIKGWGVNERGQPSDGGFGFGRFNLLKDGRDSIARNTEQPSSRRSGYSSRNKSSKGTTRHQPVRSRSQTLGTQIPVVETDSPQLSVDAIFSAHSDGVLLILRIAR